MFATQFTDLQNITQTFYGLQFSTTIKKTTKLKRKQHKLSITKQQFHKQNTQELLLKAKVEELCKIELQKNKNI